MMVVEFRPAAAADLEEASDWYEAKKLGLGIEFLESVRAALDAIVKNPNQYPVLYRNTRRALVKRFPYGIFYRIIKDRILVIACMHGRRRPARWKSRT